jgi:hypothetical protein
VPGNPKPSLHLSFEEFVPSRHFHHLPSLKLNSHIDDPALMRERLTYGLARAFGIVAPREVHAASSSTASTWASTARKSGSRRSS